MSRYLPRVASVIRPVSCSRSATLSLVQRSFQSSRRGYSSSARSSTSSTTRLIVGASCLAASGGVFYYYTNKSQPFATEKAPAVFKPTKEDYQRVYNEIARLLVEKDDYDDGSYGPVLVRLAWHCSGTYDAATGTGGSNGATMRFAPESDHGANAGLAHARNFLKPVKEKFPWISYSDLWTLAGVTAIQEMQGPVIPWRPGRQDRDVSFCTPDGRLPDGSKDHNHIRAIFGRMGFDDREIVALSGAHALGRCHPDRSGFDGPWDFSPTVMTNEFFRLLLDEKWGWKKWNGPKQYTDKSTGTLMMLPTDMALINDAEFKKHVIRYAKESQTFFKEFSDVYCKLLELGVPFKTEPKDRFTFKTTEETEE